MIEYIGVTDDPKEVGYYSGIVVRVADIYLPVRAYRLMVLSALSKARSPSFKL